MFEGKILLPLNRLISCSPEMYFDPFAEAVSTCLAADLSEGAARWMERATFMAQGVGVGT